MSDYEALQASAEDSAPVELILIEQGTRTYRFTTAGYEQTVGLDVYSPVPIKHGAISVGGEGDTPLEFAMPSSEPFAQQWALVSPADEAVMTIYAIEPDETPAPVPQVIFKGRVSTVRYSEGGKVALFAVRSIESDLGRNLPREGFSQLCNNQLYGTDCGANAAAHTFSGLVTAVDGYDVTVLNAGASGFDFNGGHIKIASASDFRLIRAQVSDVLTLSIPFPFSIVGLTVELSEGCDHLVTGHCATRFDRVRFFRGFAWVPSVDVFRRGIQK